MSVMDFCFQNADTKERNLDVLWLGMVFSALTNVTLENLFETVAVIFQRHFLSLQIKFIEFMKKIQTEYSEFCNILLYFMICYYWYKFGLLQPIFSTYYLPSFMYK